MLYYRQNGWYKAKQILCWPSGETGRNEVYYERRCFYCKCVWGVPRSWRIHQTCDEIIAVSKAAETESEVIAALESVNVFFDGWGLCYDYLSKKLTTDACRKAYMESINKNLPRRDFRMDREKYLQKAGFACWLWLWPKDYKNLSKANKKCV